LIAPEISFKSSLPDTIVFKQTEFRRFPVLAVQEQDVLLSLTSSVLNSQGEEIPGLKGVFLPGGNAFGRLDTALTFNGLCNLPPDGILKVFSIVQTTRCLETLSDTISRIFKIIPDEPTLILSSDWSGPQLIELGERETVRFTVSAKMSDSSQVQYFQANGPLTFQSEFQFSTRGSASGTIFGDFNFASSCEGDTGVLPVYFIARGGSCNLSKPLVDSLLYQIKLTFENPEIQPPPNLITNNSDGKNDFFSLNDVAPISNCASEFDYIEIFNRWGKQIYYKKGADFYWKPDSLTEGLYFYTLHFKRRNPYKGWIQVVR
jgi:gliding motility-associated-like protein